MRSSTTTTVRNAVLPANLVSLAVAAEHIGVHPKTLRRRIADGSGPCAHTTIGCGIGPGHVPLHRPSVVRQSPTPWA